MNPSTARQTSRSPARSTAPGVARPPARRSPRPPIAATSSAAASTAAISTTGLRLNARSAGVNSQPRFPAPRPSDPFGGRELVVGSSGVSFAPPGRMARAIWKGSIAFGLVNIPVELHTAVRDSRPRFRMLHAEDKSPVKFERICAREGKPVAWDELVKGYEYEKGRFVVLTKEDFKAAALEKTRTIDIRNFVKGEAIDD